MGERLRRCLSEAESEATRLKAALANAVEDGADALARASREKEAAAGEGKGEM